MAKHSIQAAMMPNKTKRELRDQLDRETAQYLNRGGRIDQVAPGVSGRENSAPLPALFVAGKASEERTPVTEIIAAVEARRKPPLLRKPGKKVAGRPRKKLIMDDFGQPLRWEWVDS